MHRMLQMTATLLLAATVGRGAEPEWPAPLPTKNKAGTRVVLAEGIGATRDEALRDALRSAVQQVVKTLVSTETVTANEKVIRDEILTAAAGMVDGYKELAIADEGGRKRVRIIARVAEKQVSARLTTVRVPLQPAEVDGQALFAEAVTAAETAKTTARWLSRGLQGYPYGCVRFEMHSYKLLAERSTDATETMALTLKESIDVAAYKKLSEWLDYALEALAVRAPIPFTYEANRNPRDPDEYNVPLPECPKMDRTRHMCVSLVTSVRGDNPVQVAGRYFVLSKVAYDVFLKSKPRVFARITAKDKAGQVLKEDEFQWDSSAVFNYCLGDIVVSPSLNMGQLDRARIKSYYDTVRLELPTEKIKLVTKVELSVVTKPK